MSETVVLQLPDRVVRSGREVAARSRRRFEDVLVEWIDRTVAELPVEYLPDDQVLALCDLTLDPAQQAELSQLLVGNREGTLSNVEISRLDALMQIYRRGLVRKAQALHIAAQRGLRPALS